jgi:hypothetical protein
MGALSQPRHELQWQIACTAGSPVISSCTAPQMQPALYVLFDIFLSLRSGQRKVAAGAG